MGKILIVVLLITIVSLFVMSKIDPNIANNVSAASQLSDANYYTITISGAVTKPGAYVLQKGSTMDDLIVAAGGPTANTDEKTYFLDTKLIGGMTYFIGSLYDDNDVCNDSPIVKVNINSDKSDALQTINGIGSTISQAIIRHREDKGIFTYLEDIMNVSGVGTSTYTKIRNYIVLQ
ncbi:MAG: helix-hairpin-helix domain-containing protein [Bacilli bacterium]|jgi:competence protein ComEA|nr:helix-hairpin-helix domain-containing protein [Bacilli bacterium]